MEARLLAIRGVTKSHPQLTGPRLEMTRYSLEKLTRETGVTAVDVQNRMADFGDRRLLAQPRAVDRARAVHPGGRRDCGRGRTSTTGSPCCEHVCREAYDDPEIVRSAPHNQVVHRVDGRHLDDPAAGPPPGGPTGPSRGCSEPFQRCG